MKPATKWVEVAVAQGPPAGKAILATLADNAIALFNVDGVLFALDDFCIRCGSSLAAGKLQAFLITCSGCDWQYDATTGCVSRIPALRIDTFETKIADSRIMVATTAKPYTGP